MHYYIEFYPFNTPWYQDITWHHKTWHQDIKIQIFIQWFAYIREVSMQCKRNLTCKKNLTSSRDATWTVCLIQLFCYWMAICCPSIDKDTTREANKGKCQHPFVKSPLFNKQQIKGKLLKVAWHKSKWTVQKSSKKDPISHEFLTKEIMTYLFPLNWDPHLLFFY